MTSADSISGRSIALLAVILVAALVLRLIVVFSLSDEIYWYDAKEYHRLAVGLTQSWAYSDSDGSPTAFWPPGYPFFLALVYMVFGPSVTAVRVVQAAIGSVTCVLLYFIALRLVGRRAAILASALAAIYPLLVYTAGALYPAALQTFLLACVIHLCLVTRQTSSHCAALGAGLVAGCSALLAPSALPALLLTAVWLAWPRGREWRGLPSDMGRGETTGPDLRRDATKPGPGPQAPGNEEVGREVPTPGQGSRVVGGRQGSGGRDPGCGSRRSGGSKSNRLARQVTPAIMFLVPIVMATGAWSIRNYRAFKQPVAVSTNGGFNLWLGNHPDVTATTGNRMTDAMRRELGAIYARHKNEADRDRTLHAKALDYISADPGRFVRLSAAKAANLWRLYPEPATDVRPAGGREKLLSVLSYGVLLPFGAFWLFRCIRRSSGARLILLVFIGYTLTHALYISKVRFRIPVDPYVIAYAAGALLSLLDLLRRRAARQS